MALKMLQNTSRQMKEVILNYLLFNLGNINQTCNFRLSLQTNMIVSTSITSSDDLNIKAQTLRLLVDIYI